MNDEEILKYGTPIECIAWLSNQQGDKLYDIYPHKEKHSNPQNNLYWKIVGIIAKSLREPNTYVHNYLLRRTDFFDGTKSTVVIDTPEDDIATMYESDRHLKPTNSTFENSNGIRFRWYREIRGIRKLKVDEMSLLIDMALKELHDMGLELPPDDITQKALEEHERTQNDGRKNC